MAFLAKFTLCRDTGLAMAAGLALLVSISPAHSQVPSWTEHEWRERNYPSSEFYAGFSYNRLNSGNVAKALKALEKDAQNKLSESIVVNLSGQTSLETSSIRRSENGESSESIERNARQMIQSTTESKLAKMETRSYANPETNELYAFAFVRKSDLFAYYASQINGILGKTESMLLEAAQLKNSDKKKAKSRIAAAEAELEEVLPFQKFLQIVDFSAGETALQNGRKQALFSRILNMKTEFSKKASVFLTSDNDYIANNLPGIISDSDCGCEVLENKSNADFTLTATGKIDRCTENSGRVFCYAGGSLVIYNSATRQSQKFGFSGVKEGWSNRSTAEEKAFKSLANEMKEKIVEYMNGR